MMRFRDKRGILKEYLSATFDKLNIYQQLEYLSVTYFLGLALPRHHHKKRQSQPHAETEAGS